MPLSGGGWVASLVIRVAPKSVVLAYFFGRKFDETPTIDHVCDLAATDAILIARVIDLGIHDGNWPSIGVDANWHREEWPVPVFGARLGLDESRALKVHAGEDGFSVIRTELCSIGEIRSLPDANEQMHKYIEGLVSAITAGQTKSHHDWYPEVSPELLERGQATDLVHYAYFNDKQSAEKCKSILDDGKRRVSISLMATDDRWLTLIVEPALEVSSVEVASDSVASVASKLGGEYDGWIFGPTCHRGPN